MRPPRAARMVPVLTSVCFPTPAVSTPNARASDIGSSVLVLRITWATPVLSAFLIRMNVLETHVELMPYVRILSEDTTANARLVAPGTHSLGASVVGPPSTPAEMLAVDLTPSASLKASLPSASAPLESPTATHWWSAPPKKKENASQTLTAQVAWRVCEESVLTHAAFELPVETMPFVMWSSTSLAVSVLSASLGVLMFAAAQIHLATVLSSHCNRQ